ncbi:MAG: hypothetical protein Dasosvirus1_14 [Dasosvirus sp.]|uniref:Uncharacterized protein n=1 Tax=Dasosvirus sp. TaxID=2487764 RepID=A0A3G4ZVB8_9VIRU|nr:MAG: hypothetical protein Dasosvirus1_14 [Dasosvirus sp.]
MLDPKVNTMCNLNLIINTDGGACITIPVTRESLSNGLNKKIELPNTKYFISVVQTGNQSACIEFSSLGNNNEENNKEIKKKLDQMTNYDQQLDQVIEKKTENIITLTKNFYEKLSKENDFEGKFIKDNEKLLSLLSDDLNAKNKSLDTLESLRQTKSIDIKFLSDEFSWNMNVGDCFHYEKFNISMWLMCTFQNHTVKKQCHTISDKGIKIYHNPKLPIFRDIKPDIKISKKFITSTIPIVYNPSVDSLKGTYTRFFEPKLCDVFMKNRKRKNGTTEQSKLKRTIIKNIDGQFFAEDIAVDEKDIYQIKTYKLSDLTLDEKVLALWTLDRTPTRFYYGKINNFENDKCRILFDDGDQNTVGLNQLWKFGDLPKHIRGN